MKPNNTAKNYSLVEVKEPQLYQDIFPHNPLPRIVIDNKILPLNPAKEFYLTDTSFRDGQQGMPVFTPEQVKDMFTLLHKLGGPSGLIRQSEFFLLNDKQEDIVESCKSLGYKYPEITGWITADKKYLKHITNTDTQETGILTSVSDYHIYKKMNLTRKGALDKYLAMAHDTLDANISFRAHFEDITRADLYGFVVPFAQELMKLREQVIKNNLNIKIRACDTLGLGVSAPGVAPPRSIEKIITALINDAGVPSEALEWHGHNDFHKATINSLTAWLYGCQYINCTFLGIGERTGNTPIEAMIMDYIQLKGGYNGANTFIIKEIKQYFEKKLGHKLPKNYPYIGENAFTTEAGIHADGMSKDERIYLPFDSHAILDIAPKTRVGSLSGKAGIYSFLLERPEVKKSGIKLSKKDPGIEKIALWVEDQYSKKDRTFTISDEELLYQATLHYPQIFVSDYDIIKERAKDTAISLLEELVQSEKIKSMVPKVQEKLLEQKLKDNPFIQFAYITDKKGLKITDNITHIEDKKKYKSIGRTEDYSDREWFINPIKTKEIYITDQHESKYTEAIIFTVSGPIYKQKKLVGVIGLDIRFDDIARVVRAINGL